MIKETELNLFVPSPELLIRLASEELPFGVRAGPPRIKSIRETFFDTSDQALRRRGMTCKLRQVEGEPPTVVVTVGEGPDSEGITSRSRLTADAVGAGVFETLRGDSAPAAQIQKFVDPGKLRPQIALDIQRLGRVFRGGFLLKPVLLLFFDRIAVQVGGSSSVFHEISIRRRREGGPPIRDLARQLRDQHHLFPDGLTRLQRAYRVLAGEGKASGKGLSPYGLNLALAVFREGNLALQHRESCLRIPTFRGSGEDAARALMEDLTGSSDLPLVRLGTTEPREGRAMAELWAIPDTGESSEGVVKRPNLQWIPWPTLLEEVGRRDLRDPTLISALLLLTRRNLLGQLHWLKEESCSTQEAEEGDGGKVLTDDGDQLPPELLRLKGLYPLIRTVESSGVDLRNRLEAITAVCQQVNLIFLQDVTRAKGKILSCGPGEDEEILVQLVDLISIRMRGLVSRMDRCVQEVLLSELEKLGVHFRPWEGLMNADRLAVLEEFSERHLPSMHVAPEWGPSFIPDMPLAGTAVGIVARLPGMEGTRYFHMVLDKDTPSFMAVPGSTTILPMEEVIRGYFLTQYRELERGKTYAFRFTTGAALVREPAPKKAATAGAETEGVPEANTTRGQEGEDPPEPVAFPENGSPPGSSRPSDGTDMVETRQSVVVEVRVQRKMPESYQAQLLRALERQVTRRNPLIGWSDLYPVTGPLDLAGLERFLDSSRKPEAAG